jgi:hypothetical protein
MGKTLEMRVKRERGILNKMRLFVALTLWPRLCVSPTKKTFSGLAPTNCKLVFNSTSFQMDCEQEWVEADERE